jgi:hypothetical protein
MPCRQRLFALGVFFLLACSALPLTACSQENALKRTVPLRDLLALRREIPLVTPDSSLEPSAFLFLTP